MIRGTANFVGWISIGSGNSIDKIYQAVRGININLLAVFFIVVLAGVLLYNFLWPWCRRKVQRAKYKSVG